MSIQKDKIWLELEYFLRTLMSNDAPMLTEEEIKIYKNLAFSESPAEAAELLELKLRNGPLTGEPAEIFARQLSLIVGLPIRARDPRAIPVEEISAWATVKNEKKSDAEPAWF